MALPSIWEIIVKNVPLLKASPGGDRVGELKEWIQTGTFPRSLSSLPNILLTPFVVALQLSQYQSYLETTYPQGIDQHEANVATVKHLESVAFCTGLLSAIAISASRNDAALKENGAIAMRIATLVGAIVDDHDASGEKEAGSRSISVAWTSPEVEEEMLSKLKQHSDVST